MQVMLVIPLVCSFHVSQLTCSAVKDLHMSYPSTDFGSHVPALSDYDDCHGLDALFPAPVPSSAEFSWAPVSRTSSDSELDDLLGNVENVSSGDSPASFESELRAYSDALDSVNAYEPTPLSDDGLLVAFPYENPVFPTEL